MEVTSGQAGSGVDGASSGSVSMTSASATERRCDAFHWHCGIRIFWNRSLKDGIQRKRKKRTRAAVKKGSRGLRSRFVLVFSSRAVCRDLRLFGDRRAGCLIHPLFLMYSAVDASSRVSGAPKTTNKTPRLPSAVSGGNKAPWRLGTPYGAKSAPPREWYPTSVRGGH